MYIITPRPALETYDPNDAHARALHFHTENNYQEMIDFLTHNEAQAYADATHVHIRPTSTSRNLIVGPAVETAVDTLLRAAVQLDGSFEDREIARVALATITPDEFDAMSGLYEPDLHLPVMELTARKIVESGLFKDPVELAMHRIDQDDNYSEQVDHVTIQAI